MTIELTGYAKIDRVIRQAHSHGLVVKTTRHAPVDSVVSQISVDVSIPVDSRDDDNMLGAVNRATSLYATWTWIQGNGRTPRLSNARAYRWGGTEDLTKTQKRKVGDYAYRTTTYANIESQLYVMGNAAKRYLEEAE